MNEEYIKLQVEGSDWSYGSAWGDQMEEAITNWFAKDIPKDARILDIGCGEGRGLDALKKQGFDSVFGVDIALEKIKKARENGHHIFNVDFHLLDTQESVKKFFDYTFCSHTLEHSYDIIRALKSIEYVTKKALYFIVPVGETKEEVEKYNPSHTFPFKDLQQIEHLLINHSYNDYILFEQKRMCKEVWGIINYE